MRRLFVAQPGKPERKTETARYLMLWALGTGGKWRFSRIFSYGRELAK